MTLLKETGLSNQPTQFADQIAFPSETQFYIIFQDHVAPLIRRRLQYPHLSVNRRNLKNWHSDHTKAVGLHERKLLHIILILNNLRSFNNKSFRIEPNAHFSSSLGINPFSGNSLY
jgi:hypothetical protein